MSQDRRSLGSIRSTLVHTQTGPSPAAFSAKKVFDLSARGSAIAVPPPRSSVDILHDDKPKESRSNSQRRSLTSSSRTEVSVSSDASQKVKEVVVDRSKELKEALVNIP